MNTGIKVLVIDDSNTIRRSAEAFLRQAGFNVVLAEDGFDALAKISDHHPQVIFVDIMMPRLDGYQTCALIKQNPTLQDHARDHAVEQGRHVRPRARQARGLRSVSDQAVHQRGAGRGGSPPCGARAFLTRTTLKGCSHAHQKCLDRRGLADRQQSAVRHAHEERLWRGHRRQRRRSARARSSRPSPTSS